MYGILLVKRTRSLAVAEVLKQVLLHKVNRKNNILLYISTYLLILCDKNLDSSTEMECEVTRHVLIYKH